MGKPKKKRLQDYTVRLRQAPAVDYDMVFAADNLAHAVEQAENAAPDDEIISVCLKKLPPRNIMEIIGEAGVDAGMLMIGDPCYFINTPGERCAANLVYDRGWQQFCDMHAGLDGEAEDHQMCFAKGHAGLGVTFSTTWGDGVYPVLVCRHPERGTPRFALVIMDGTPVSEIIR